MSPGVASIFWSTPRSWKNGARRWRLPRRRNGPGAATRNCSTRPSCRPTKAAISISCAARGRDSVLARLRNGCHARESGHPVLRGDELEPRRRGILDHPLSDRKSTRLNSSHDQISYAVFCLKKKKKTTVIYLSQHKQNRQ